jgi:hypothetical protein
VPAATTFPLAESALWGIINLPHLLFCALRAQLQSTLNVFNAPLRPTALPALSASQAPSVINAILAMLDSNARPAILDTTPTTYNALHALLSAPTAPPAPRARFAMSVP